MSIDVRHMLLSSVLREERSYSGFWSLSIQHPITPSVRGRVESTLLALGAFSLILWRFLICEFLKLRPQEEWRDKDKSTYKAEFASRIRVIYDLMSPNGERRVNKDMSSKLSWFLTLNSFKTIGCPWIIMFIASITFDWEDEDKNGGDTRLYKSLIF